MNFNDLIAKQVRLDSLTERFEPLLGAEMDSLKRKHGIDGANQLGAALQEVENTDRTLRIGVVGRMKAGKSSLLNALLFDGSSVLPKAATPMTAALTTISWGEEVSAEVEFYSQEDKYDIARKAEEYNQQLQSLINQKSKGLLQQLREKQKQRADAQVSCSATEEAENESAHLTAKKAAELEMRKQVRLTAAHDQHQRMQSSPAIKEALDEAFSIEANDLDSLKKSLVDYVSANGRYMPFCKSVHIKMPLDSLRGLEVVDTPGFNDPVVSREMRTNEILGRCDVILIVSPSGRLLTAEDMALMGRIAHKDGVRELFVVVSQTDMQLYGSERRASLEESLNVIQTKNAIRAEAVFHTYCNDEPEAREVFYQILDDADNRVVCVSSIASSIVQRIQQGKALDSDHQNMLRMISEHYPNSIKVDDKKSILDVMNGLSGISLVEDILRSATIRKSDILEERKRLLVEVKEASIHDFSAEVVSFSRQRVQDLESTDIDELNREISHLGKVKETLSLEINHDFRDHRIALPGIIKSELRSVLEKAYRSANTGIDDSESTQKKSHRGEKKGLGNWIARNLWGGGYEESSYEVPAVSTSRASKSILQFVNNIADDMKDVFNTLREDWRKQVHQSIVKSYRSIVGDEGVDKRLVLRSINDLVQGLQLGDFALDRKLPEKLKARGTLENSEATSYLDQARDYIAIFHGKIGSAISTCIDNIDVSLPDDVAAAFYKELDERVNLMKEQIENKRETLSRFAELEISFQELVK